MIANSDFEGFRLAPDVCKNNCENNKVTLKPDFLVLQPPKIHNGKCLGPFHHPSYSIFNTLL